MKGHMTDQEIFTKALEKAKTNGYKMYFTQREIQRLLQNIDRFIKYYPVIFDKEFARAFWGEFRNKPTNTVYYEMEWEKGLYDMSVEEFEENFGQEARTQLQKGEEFQSGSTVYWLQFEAVNMGWEYHLKQMVLEENPIKYLEQFIDKETNERT